MSRAPGSFQRGVQSDGATAEDGTGLVREKRARPYQRSMAGWWRRDPFFARYMLREATALAVMAYVVLLIAGLDHLAQGAAAWQQWLGFLRSGWSLVLHGVLLLAMLFHAYSWFEIMPKTLPNLYVGQHRVPAGAIQAGGWAAVALVSMLVWVGFRWSVS